MADLVSGLDFQELGVGALPEETLAGSSIIAIPSEEAGIVRELQEGSEKAYCWLIAQYHQPVYSLLYRMLNDSADASDTTQEVFIKVFRGIKSFNGNSSLKTWLYRIAIHEAYNQRRWWWRHKRRETSIEPAEAVDGNRRHDLKETLQDHSESPFQHACGEEARARVECELRKIPEAYRAAVVLRDIEELSYEEVADVLGVSMGTVKSRLTRGRQALRERLQAYAGDLRRP